MPSPTVPGSATSAPPPLPRCASPSVLNLSPLYAVFHEPSSSSMAPQSNQLRGRAEGSRTDASAEAPPRSTRRRRAASTAPAEPAPSRDPAQPREVILVGCGTISRQFYLPALRALETAGTIVVRTVVDPIESSRTMFGRLFPKSTPHPSLDSVVAPPDALVVIATAPRFHAAQTLAAFKRGWHVLCHTPFATNLREANQMIAAANRHERLLSVSLFKRFFPATRYLRTLCRDHLLGPPLSFSIHEGGPSSWPAAPLSHPEKFELPDGVLAEVGVHTLDLLVWFFGTPSVVRYADDAMGGVEANAHLELAFPEGVRGTVHLSRDWPTAQSYAFVFERAVVRWDVDEGNRLTVQLASAPTALNAELVEPLSALTPHERPSALGSNARSFIAQLENIVAAIAGRRPLAVPATAALDALPLIQECYSRRTLIEQPWLTRNEVAHARVLAMPADLRRI
jgi:predicted dehydrogenase